MLQRGIGGTGVYFTDSGPPKNYVIEEIIHEISEHDPEGPTDNVMSVWENLDSDVEEDIRCDGGSSSDSSVPNSRVISKSTLVTIKPCFNN